VIIYIQDCKNVATTWKRILKEIPNMNQECIFGAGAQFIVSKNKILKNSKDFYKNIVKILEYTNNPCEGFDVEIFYKYIFN
jgi:hypothetical protein